MLKSDFKWEKRILPFCRWTWKQTSSVKLQALELKIKVTTCGWELWGVKQPLTPLTPLLHHWCTDRLVSCDPVGRINYSRWGKHKPTGQQTVQPLTDSLAKLSSAVTHGCTTGIQLKLNQRETRHWIVEEIPIQDKSFRASLLPPTSYFHRDPIKLQETPSEAVKAAIQTSEHPEWINSFPVLHLTEHFLPFNLP